MRKPLITKLKVGTGMWLCAEDQPVVAMPSSMDVAENPRVTLYTADGQPLVRRLGY